MATDSLAFAISVLDFPIVSEVFEKSFTKGPELDGPIARGEGRKAIGRKSEGFVIGVAGNE
jgi:hypothetical protein